MGGRASTKDLKATVKGYKNRLADLTKSREQWRIRAERDVHHASTDRTVTVKDVEFQQSEIRVRRPSVSHFAYLRDHEPSVDSQNQLGCYASKSRNSSRLADRCILMM